MRPIQVKGKRKERAAVLREAEQRAEGGLRPCAEPRNWRPARAARLHAGRGETAQRED